MGPNVSSGRTQRLKNENIFNINSNEVNPYIEHRQPRGFKDLKMEENMVKTTKDEKIQRKQTSKKAGKIENYLRKSGEGQGPPPSRHVEDKDSLKEEEYVGIKHQNNSTTYLDKPHAIIGVEVLHDILEKAELDENTDVDQAEITYSNLVSKGRAHNNRLQLPEKEMSEQKPDNKTRAKYLNLIHSRFVGLEIRDVSKTKPEDEDHETYLHRPTSPSPCLTGAGILEGEKEGLIKLNNEKQETYNIVIPRRVRTARLEEEKEGLIKMRNENEKQETYNVNNVRSVGAARLKEEKEDLIKTKMNIKKLGTYDIKNLARTRVENILEKKEDVHTDINASTHCKTYLGHFSPSPPYSTLSPACTTTTLPPCTSLRDLKNELKNEEFYRGKTQEENKTYRRSSWLGQAGPDDPNKVTLKKENDFSNDKGEDNSYIMECPPTARDSVISLKNVECDKNVDSTNNTNRKTYMDLPTSHAVGEETINLKKMANRL